MMLFFLLIINAAVALGRPNIVFILTDDQDVEIGGMTPMEKTKQLIAEKGVTFSNAFATTPVCCPSRSSILTGLYLHNTKAHNNSLSGGCSNKNWQDNFEPISYAAYLQNAGYTTFYAGKYLNQYGYNGAGGTQHVPVGWDWWIGLVGNSVYYNYSLSVNGSKVSKGDNEDDYLTDVLKEYSLQFLNQKQISDGFLMVVSTPSAHAPFTPANRHKGKFQGMKAPRTPSFNIPVSNEKHWLLRLPPEILPNETIDIIDERFRNRLETLLAVDELVDSIINKLEELKVLNNTFIIFSSDHGYHLGQFGLPWDKRQPYEFDIKIPLLVRGPGVPENQIIPHPVLTIDFAPTILDMAGIDATHTMDGESFLPKVNSAPDSKIDRMFLIEYIGEGFEYSKHISRDNPCYGDTNLTLCQVEASCKCQDSSNNTYACIRRLTEDVNELYCKFADDEDFTEFYDLKNDPYQLNNLGLDDKKRSILDHNEILDCCQRNIEIKKSVNDCFS